MSPRIEWKLPAIIGLVCFAAFANSLGGEFVYDDLRQIVRNPLIQDNALIWQALSSDVWAFKGDGTRVASNYWRPTFTLWQILNFRLFGLSPFGWHISNVLLHVAICLLVFALLRRWSFSELASFSVALIFAVHPVHVESVAWISGSPDLLFSLAFLGGLWFTQSYAETASTRYLIFSLLLYAVALGAKEVSIFCFPIFYLVLVSGGQKGRLARSGMFLFLGVAIVYFILRLFVLGAVSRPPENAVGMSEAILSFPTIFLFYLRQIFFPYWLGANYPIEPVVSVDLGNVIIPLVISVTILSGLFYLAARSDRIRLAAGLFLLPLLPTMNATLFEPEQIVHDRYLYLPLLGVLMILVIISERFIGDKKLIALVLVLCILLSVQTISYSSAWKNDLTLWKHTTSIDDSAFTLSQYGNELINIGRYDEAVSVLSRSIAKRPKARAYLSRARAYLVQKRYSDAETDLQAIINLPLDKLEAYVLYQAYSLRAIALTEQGRLDEAEKAFREARTKLPIYTASITADLAVVLYQRGRKEEALRELENSQNQARRELLPESKRVFLRLGMLYTEMGRSAEARGALAEFLAFASHDRSDQFAVERQHAAAELRRLNTETQP
ncbi:tetratricopeptide repeat protein [Leptolyngbya sp. 7M]|uniref:tetratricopeptide repeat protein n=1 Tax=Leptolyngbya sp. 7M TaxID=2812896 RepID=UPI001B8C7BC6|nr:tetratricopeptide repeat protein [Leptolyngbya sp. 7M]QYO65369.1 tetratricopeptide repeat protein [Leptolyngbya sp. 7M]